MLAGVYKIVNLNNGSLYIGSSKNLKRREKEHFSLLRKGISHCKILQRAFDKYGESNFQFVILVRCAIEDLFKLEQYFVDLLKPKYNICIKNVRVPVGLPHKNYKDVTKYKKLAISRLKTSADFGWKSRKIGKLDKEGKITKEYSSLKEYANEHNCSVANVGKALKTGNKCKGNHVKYLP